MVSKRTIPENLGGQEDFLENVPGLGRVEASDGLLAFVPPMLTFIALNNFTNLGFYASWGGPLFILTLGFAILAAKPDYISFTEIVSNYINYRQMPKDIEKKVDTSSYEYSEPAPVQAGEDETVNYIGIKRLYPRNNAMLKTDDNMVGMVEVGGMNLDIQSGGALETAADGFEDFFNNQLSDRGYELQIYMPMRKFSPGNKMSDLSSRKEDREISDNKIMKRYVEDRKVWMEDKLSEHLVRKFYIVVEVSVQEATDNKSVASGGIDIEKIPGSDIIEGMKAVFGNAVSGLGSMSDDEIKEEQIKTLNERLSFIKTNMKQSDGQKVEIKGAEEMGVLLREFWEGEDVRKSEIDNYIRRKPIVTRKR